MDQSWLHLDVTPFTSSPTKKKAPPPRREVVAWRVEIENVSLSEITTVVKDKMLQSNTFTRLYNEKEEKFEDVNLDDIDMNYHVSNITYAHHPKSKSSWSMADIDTLCENLVKPEKFLDKDKPLWRVFSILTTPQTLLFIADTQLGSIMSLADEMMFCFDGVEVRKYKPTTPKLLSQLTTTIAKLRKSIFRPYGDRENELRPTEPAEQLYLARSERTPVSPTPKSAGNICDPAIWEINLAILGGALRSYFKSKGEEKSLQVTAEVHLSKDIASTEVPFMLPIDTGLASPLQQLAATTSVARSALANHMANAPDSDINPTLTFGVFAAPASTTICEHTVLDMRFYATSTTTTSVSVTLFNGLSSTSVLSPCEKNPSILTTAWAPAKRDLEKEMLNNPPKLYTPITASPTSFFLGLGVIFMIGVMMRGD